MMLCGKLFGFVRRFQPKPLHRRLTEFKDRRTREQQSDLCDMTHTGKILSGPNSDTDIDLTGHSKLLGEIFSLNCILRKLGMR